MALDTNDLAIIEDMINQKVDSKILLLRQDFGARIEELKEAVQSLMESLESLK